MGLPSCTQYGPQPNQASVRGYPPRLGLPPHPFSLIRVETRLGQWRSSNTTCSKALNLQHTMARGGGRSGSARPVSSELHQNTDPPQSSLAVQLVKHFTEGQKYPKNQDQEIFRQLLHELLDADNDQQLQAETLRTNSDVNYKLILVVVKAGLELRANEDPFAEQGHRHKQVTDSLAAVNVTIQRSPAALFFVPRTQEGSLGHEGPLFLWLIPRLLVLIDQNKAVKDNDNVLKVLGTICSQRRNSHVERMKVNPIHQYFKSLLHGKLG